MGVLFIVLALLDPREQPDFCLVSLKRLAINTNCQLAILKIVLITSTCILGFNSVNERACASAHSPLHKQSRASGRLLQVFTATFAATFALYTCAHLVSQLRLHANRAASQRDHCT